MVFHSQNDGNPFSWNSLFSHISDMIMVSEFRKGGAFLMGGNYEKGLYKQLMDVMERLDAMESECKKAIRRSEASMPKLKS